MEPSQRWQEQMQSLQGETDFSKHWQAYREIGPEPAPAWAPDGRKSNLAAMMAQMGLTDYASFHAWSASAREAFWSQAIERLQVPMATLPERILTGDAENPKWLEGARLNIADACLQGEHAAMVFGRTDGSFETTTRAELRAQVGGLMEQLQDAGFQPGDAVALYMPMTPFCVAAYLAIVRAGMAVVSIPDSFAAPEIETRLRLANAKGIITVESFLRGGKEVPMASKARDAAGDAKVLLAGDDLVLRAGSAEPYLVEPQAVSNILFSSGTTGEPKAIPWTHLTPMKCMMDGHFHQDIKPGDVVAWPTNIGWMMGPWLIYAALGNQATIALYEDMPTAPGFVDFVNGAKVTMLGVVPAIVRAWLQQGIPPARFGNRAVVFEHGEASNAHDYLYLMSLASYRAPVIEYCGGTEIGGAHITGSVLQPAVPATFTTPALGLDFVILDDDNQPVGPGEHGQIYLVPPSIGLSQRLLNRDHHKEYFEGCPGGPDGEVLRRHGDEMHVLEEGWAAGGRADDTMNLGGIKVSSIELESAMNGSEGVAETAAVAIRPDGGGADQLVVFAVAPGLTADALQPDLQGRIKHRLNPLFRIHDVVIVDALPRTASNKVMRRELRDQYAVANASSGA